MDTISSAGTYSLATYLPARLLDTLLLFPRRLLAYQHWLRNETASVDREVREMRNKTKDKGKANEHSQVAIVPPKDQLRNSQVEPLLKEAKPVLANEGHLNTAPVSSTTIPLTDPEHESGVDSAEEGDVESINSGAPSENGDIDQRLTDSWVSLKDSVAGHPSSEGGIH